MDLYLPIAGVSVDALVLAGLGLAIGLVSGVLGIGGGFLLTPLLVFMGIPPATAAASVTGHIVSSTTSGLMAPGRVHRFDVRLALVLATGGVVGTFGGVELVNLLGQWGAADAAVAVFYVVFLLGIGWAMLHESGQAIRRLRAGLSLPPRRRRSFMHRVPGRVRFRASRLFISPVPIAVLGVLTGVLAALMGVGGGFILIPALMYLVCMPARLATTTATIQILLISGLAVLLHAGRNQTVDVLLVAVLMVGGALGAQWGGRFAFRARAEYLRFLLAALILALAARLIWGMVITPVDAYAILGGA